MKHGLKLALSLSLLICCTSAAASQAPWMLSLRDEFPKARELGFGQGYDISSSRMHVPVTQLMARAFDAAARNEVVAFLELLAAEDAYREQRHYIAKCVQALKAEEKPTRSRWKYADGREVDVVYYHIPFPAIRKKAPIQPSQPTRGKAPRG